MQETRTLSSYKDDTIRPEHYMMSLVSGASDRVRTRYYEYFDQLSAEIEVLNKCNHDLNVSQQRVDEILRGLTNEIESLKAYTNEMRQKNALLSANIDRKKHMDKANVEDAVVATTPLYRQIMNLFAEELALQDFIFYLNEGLMNKTISLDVYMKQVRVCSRKQFMVRALILQCREVAGLN